MSGMAKEDCKECDWQTGGRVALTMRVIKMLFSPPVWIYRVQQRNLQRMHILKKVGDDGLLIHQKYICTLEHVCLISAWIGTGVGIILFYFPNLECAIIWSGHFHLRLCIKQKCLHKVSLAWFGLVTWYCADEEIAKWVCRYEIWECDLVVGRARVDS